MHPHFLNRTEAGIKLGAFLADFRTEDPVVVAISRNGIPVAYQVARLLGAPLDFLGVEAMAPPGHPEVLLGSVAEGRAACVDPWVQQRFTMSATDIAVEADRACAAADRLGLHFREGRPRHALQNRTVLLVDDCVRDFGTAEQAAARSVRKLGARWVVLASPIAVAGALDRLRTVLDDLVALVRPEDVENPRSHFHEFAPVGDGDTLRLIAQGRIPIVPSAADEEMRAS